MSFGETILAIFGVRKLSTSRDYKLLSRRIDALEYNDKILRDMIWSTMTDEQKREFIRRYKKEKMEQKKENMTDDLETLIKKGFWTMVGVFGGLFILYMIVYIVVAAFT